MGFFSKDWARELDRAEEHLANDRPVRALELAELAERKAEPDLRARAAGLMLRCRPALLASVLAQAAAAEEAGDFEDAADWLLSAIEQETSAVRRAELVARREQLLQRDFEDESPFLTETATLTVVVGESVAADDVTFHYETLTSMLNDDTRALYEGRGEDFQAALVDLNQGRYAEALAVLAPLATAAPEDPILRLEAGRARLVVGDASRARDDFAAAWDILGDEPLDARGEDLLPALWADASLAAGEPLAVVTRLRDLAAPETGHPEVCRLYGRALLDAGRSEEAVAHLAQTVSHLPTDTQLALLLAEGLVAIADRASAIGALERAIAPSCASGCGTPALDIVAVRTLARLHLGAEGEPERARELMAFVANATQGHLGAEDYGILADYYGAIGNPAAAEDARAEAARLSGRGQVGVPSGGGELTPTREQIRERAAEAALGSRVEARDQ